MKILNLYAGIGGNRKNWDGEKHDITAVEINQEIANIYQDYFPEDNLVAGDAHEYLKENYQEFHFIWSSPPCPTHSKIRNIAGVGSGQNEPVYPDMKLYQEIIFLNQIKNSNGVAWDGDFVVENVQSYYEPLIKPQKTHRHYFWSNFSIPDFEVETDDIQGGRNRQKQFGFDLTGYDLDSKKKGKMLRNCVNPRVGEAILEACGTKQSTVEAFQK